MDTVINRRTLQSRICVRWVNNIALGFAVFIVVSPVIFVMLWMVSLSFKNEIDNIAYPPVWIPNPLPWPTTNRFSTAAHLPSIHSTAS